MQQSSRFLSLLLILLIVILNLVACNVQQIEPNRNLEPTVSQTFDVYQDTTNPNIYHADSTTTSSSYTGTLKEVVEDAMNELDLGGGGTIAFRAGVFDLGSDYFLIKNKNNIIFEGQGIDITVVQNNSSASADTEPFNGSKSDDITIRNLTVSAGGSTRSTSDAIDGDEANNWLVENVKIDESRGRGIIFDGKAVGQTADGNTIRNCIIDGISNHGIQLLASSNNLIENCTITNLGSVIGILITKASSSSGNKQSTDNIIRNNTIDNINADGIKVSSSSQNTITNNTITNSSDGIQISSSSGVSCDDNVVEFNTATSNSNYGLNIDDPECNRTVVWDNNNFIGNGSGEVNDNGTDTIFMSNDTEPPTTPSNLIATNVQANQVTLNWDPSSDNVGVTAYDIYRDGGKIDEVGGSTTTYQDNTVIADTTYAYFVRARDAAGNESLNSNTINVTTPPPSQVTTFTPTDDATIRESNPTSNYGSNSNLEIDASSRKDTLLRFNVSGVGTSSINNVTLRLYATDGSTVGGDFVEVTATSGNWDENTVTWNNAPTGDGISLGSLGNVSPNNWYELDVTPLVSGDGAVSIRISSSSENGADYASKENSNGNAPELVVTLGDPPEPDTEPPTAPSNLTATSVQTNQVNLDWDASTDNVGVIAYDIYRDSTKIAEIGGSTTTYQDTTVSANTSYAYFIRARDLAGNQSPQSNTINVTTPPNSSGFTFTPTDDATIRKGNPTNNYGNNPNIEVDASSRKDTLLRFDINGVSSSINNVILRLYTIDSSSSGGDFVEITVTSGNWDEDTVTWSNAPTGNGISLGSLGSVIAGNWYELDVTPLVSGNGPVSIRISSSSENGADYASKENSNGNAPELIVTTN